MYYVWCKFILHCILRKDIWLIDWLEVILKVTRAMNYLRYFLSFWCSCVISNILMFFLLFHFLFHSSFNNILPRTLESQWYTITCASERVNKWYNCHITLSRKIMLEVSKMTIFREIVDITKKLMTTKIYSDQS